MPRLSPFRKQPTERTVETDVRARQGPSGRPVLAVVTGSLALLAIYLIGMMAWSSWTVPSNPREELTRAEVAPLDRETEMEEIPPANPAYPAPAVPTVR
jgi:cytochrome c-type biogenesis protein CcmH/NrfG